MASRYRKLRTKWDSWRLGRDVKAGRKLRGRQPPAGEMEVKAEPKAEMTLRVFRAATGEWEDVT